MPFVETHPFEPWLPQGARLLMLGTFPLLKSDGVCLGIIPIFKTICGEYLVLCSFLIKIIL